MSTGATITKKVTIQNTLYVAKNGNDSSGTRNRLDKPFLTIFAANVGMAIKTTNVIIILTR